MSEIKSIPEIMEMLDYSIEKMKLIENISESIIALGGISHEHTRKTLALGLSDQLRDIKWSATAASTYLDELEAALKGQIPAIDQEPDTTTDDLPINQEVTE